MALGQQDPAQTEKTEPTPVSRIGDRESATHVNERRFNFCRTGVRFPAAPLRLCRMVEGSPAKVGAPRDGSVIPGRFVFVLE